MISVPKSQPTIATFEQKVLSVAEARIAAEQLTKAARSEIDALSSLDNANFRLTKATEGLKAAEIAYFSAVEKSATNRDALRLAYNNALAGFRDADKAVEKAVSELAQSQDALVSLHSISKAITDGDSLKAAVKDAKTDEDKAACVAAAEKLKLGFFLPKGWAAQYKNVAKREVSADERAALAEKGMAMPDGSYPIKTAADLKNAISSYGRAKDADAVKAHIIARAKDLNASDQLPEAWSENTTKSIQKDGSMKAFLVLCPHCMGEDSDNCSTCDDDAMVGHHVLINSLGGDGDMDFGKSFSTESLLTRDFQKSAAYQDYIFSKGGPGSGPELGHPFRGNQHTGSIHEFRDGRREGWKHTSQRYEKSIPGALEAGRKAMAEAQAHSAAGRHAEAAAKAEEAKKSFEKAAGAHKGIEAIHRAQGEKGHKDADLEKANAAQQAAREIRAGEKQAAVDLMTASQAAAAAAAS